MNGLVLYSTRDHYIIIICSIVHRYACNVNRNLQQPCYQNYDLLFIPMYVVLSSDTYILTKYKKYIIPPSCAYLSKF